MSERLVIRLGSNEGDSIHWLQFNDKAQEVIASGSLNSAEELSQLAPQAAVANVQVLVPGSDVSYFEVDVPKSNRRQAIAAIPFMLEDELAADVDTLHFVYGDVIESRQSVYVCDKLRIARWLKWLSEAGISASQMLPDYLAVPVAQEPENISVLQLDNQLLFRLNSNQGLCISEQWLNVTLDLLRGDKDSLLIEHFDVQSDIHLPPHQWLAQPLVLPMQQLAMSLTKLPINLLVGEFTQNKKTNNHWKVWRSVAIAASVLVVMFFVEQLIRVNQLEQQQAQLKQQSEDIFRKLNPNVRRVLKLKSRMQNEIKSLAGGGGSNELFDMLEAMNGALSAVPELKPSTIKFDKRRNELRLQAEAGSYQQFEKFKGLLEQQYTVVMGAMNNNGNKVNGSLVVKVSS
ncbi:MAG: type II secretion system protein GspL [Gammaproteobacteria bacterium MedPE]|nr:MAG: type II secretion system protein GspL [Gammaproteobacteria bacterium MedPE]